MTTTPAILVTGAAGFAGSHLVDQLHARGEAIVGWRRPGEPLPASAPAGVEWTEVDVLDRAAVAKAVADAAPRAVYHLAGIAHVARSWDRAAQTLAVNVLGTHHLVSALLSLGRPCRLLVTGSALVYAPQDRALTEGDSIAPASPYGLSKLAQEMAARRAFEQSDLPVIVARSFNHIGPRQDPSFSTPSFARQIARIEAGLAPPELVVGNLDARRDLLDVRDTVSAYQVLLERGQPGGIYNVCSGRAYRVGEILDGLLALARVPVSVQTDPALLRRHDAPLMLGSPHRISTELGWAPRIPMERTLADLLDYWRLAAAAEARDSS